MRPLLLAALLCTSFTGCAGGPPAGGPVGPHLQALPVPDRHAFEVDAFGRTFHVTLYADSPARADEAAAAVRGRLADLSSKLDPSLPDSELARLCRDAGGPWTKVSDELLLLLQQTRRLSELQDGAADVTAGPVADLWRAAFQAGAFPPDAALDDARAVVGWNKVQIDPIERRVRLLLPGVRVDLGRRAVAYAADQMLDEVTRHGISAALVDAGDVVAAAGPPPGRPGWPITLPAQDRNVKPKAIDLRTAAVVRLGDGVRVKLIEGKPFADRVDPRTGRGATPAPGQVSAFPIATTVTAGKAFPAAQAAAAAIDLRPERLALFIRTVGGMTIQMRQPISN